MSLLCCSFLTDLAAEEHGVRRLLAAEDNYRQDVVGAMDTSLAASATIAKAVDKPSMGSAKFATHVGISEGKVATGTRQHGRWVVLGALSATCRMSKALPLHLIVVAGALELVNVKPIAADASLSCSLCLCCVAVS
jgi:hypothetical protein